MENELVMIVIGVLVGVFSRFEEDLDKVGGYLR